MKPMFAKQDGVEIVYGIFLNTRNRVLTIFSLIITLLEKLNACDILIISLVLPRILPAASHNESLPGYRIYLT